MLTINIHHAFSLCILWNVGSIEISVFRRELRVNHYSLSAVRRAAVIDAKECKPQFRGEFDYIASTGAI